MIKVLAKVQRNIFHPSQPLLIGLITLLIQFLLSLFITLIILPCMLIKNGRHFYLKLKQPKSHISGTFETTHDKHSNMIHTHFNDQCSCGKKNAPDDIFDIIYKSLDDLYY